MICGHYENKPLEGEALLPEEAGASISTRVIEERPYSDSLSSQAIELDIAKESMRLDDIAYKAFASYEKTPEGVFFVAEKWRFPYWRKNGLVYSPGESNPLGEYLIILAEKGAGKKIPQSIHTYPRSPFGRTRRGCIRLKKEDMRDLFERVELGAEVCMRK